MRSRLAGLLIVLLAATALASPIVTAVTSLASAASARATAIGTPSTTALGREKTNLAAASQALGGFKGDDLAADAAALLGAGKALKASKTTDAGVVQGVADVASCIGALADAELADANSAVSQLVMPSLLAKARKVIAAATALADQARTQAASNPVGAISTLGKALAKASKARKFAVANQNVGGPPAGVLATRHSQGHIFLFNSTSKGFRVLDVVYTLQADFSDGSSKTITVSGKKADPLTFSNVLTSTVGPGATVNFFGDAPRAYINANLAPAGAVVTKWTGAAKIVVLNGPSFYVSTIYH